MSLPPGAQLGPYQVEDLIGAGGMGEVYRARHTRLNRIVAIKILLCASFIWSLALNGSAKPKQVIEGNQLCMDVTGEVLYVDQLAKDPPQVIRMTIANGATAPIPLPRDLRPTTDGFGATAVDARGRLLIEVSSADSFFYSPALFDPARNTVTCIPVRFEGDVWGAKLVARWTNPRHRRALYQFDLAVPPRQTVAL